MVVNSEPLKRASIASSTSNHSPLCPGTYAHTNATTASSPDSPSPPSSSSSSPTFPHPTSTSTTTYIPVATSPPSSPSGTTVLPHARNTHTPNTHNHRPTNAHTHHHNPTHAPPPSTPRTKRLSATFSSAATKLRCACKDSTALVAACCAQGGRAVSQYWKPTRGAASRTSGSASTRGSASASTSARTSTAGSASGRWSASTSRQSSAYSGSGSGSLSGSEWSEGRESGVYGFGRMGVGIEDVGAWEGKGKGKGKMGEGNGGGEGDGEVVIYGADEWGTRVGVRYERGSG
ncbi:hypothetical protein MMC11_003938 [Xylographa trunciseda]|nr:hypothetical protein [Xylographa trunciseda]